MKYFTPEDLKPKESTLTLIRQIAYTYQAMRMNSKLENICFN